jgi:hypothetical protein
MPEPNHTAKVSAFARIINFVRLLVFVKVKVKQSHYRSGQVPGG